MMMMMMGRDEIEQKKEDFREFVDDVWIGRGARVWPSCVTPFGGGRTDV
jgi:hypothetical protein